MKSRALSTSKNVLCWESPLVKLSSNRKNKTIEQLSLVGINHIKDLLWVLPNKVEYIPPLGEVTIPNDGDICKARVNVIRRNSRPSNVRGFKGRKLSIVNLWVEDCSSKKLFTLNWFNCYPNQADKIQKLDRFIFLGKASYYNDSLQFTNPTILTEKESDNEYLNPVYPTINAIKPFRLAQVFKKIPQYLWDEIPDDLPKEIALKNDLLSLRDAFNILHGKVNNFDDYLNLYERAIARLKYQEFFINKLKMIARKELSKSKSTKSYKISKRDIEKTKSLFPYELTKGQLRAIEDISTDLKSGHPMSRLIQGDVGSGKTSIALAAIWLNHINGYQSAMMCPTESLALQHYKNLREVEGIKSELLLGSHSPKEKKEIKDRLKNKKIDLIVGTHSLIQKDVHFSSLGLSIIDEQHKFGVNQRLSLLEKSETRHSLVMTATPIPRSLRLTQYGDLDVSIVKDLPATRAGSKTKIVTSSTFKKFLSFVKTRILMGEQAYIVVPAIDEVEGQDIKFLTQVHERFSKYFPDLNISFVHGKLSSEDKKNELDTFVQGETDILVSTSVIEVGIDVHNATIMAIMNPERFGLSSLHQLRGRVGRGQKVGFCFLVIDDRLSKETKEKLSVIENSCDGFEIAEEDLKYRGEGNIFGVSQSGVSLGYTLANPIQDTDLLTQVNDDLDKLNSSENKELASLIEYYSNQMYVSETI